MFIINVLTDGGKIIKTVLYVTKRVENPIDIKIKHLLEEVR